MAHLIDTMKQDEIVAYCKKLNTEKLRLLMDARDYTFDTSKSRNDNVEIFAKKCDEENFELNYE